MGGNREYRSDVFCLLFRDKRRALELYSKRKKSLRLLYASGRMRTDAQRNYAALRRASGAGNESKRKRFVRFLYNALNGSNYEDPGTDGNGRIGERRNFIKREE